MKTRLVSLVYSFQIQDFLRLEHRRVWWFEAKPYVSHGWFRSVRCCSIGCLEFQGAVPAGVDLCGGDEMAYSIEASIDALTAGDESAAVFNRDIGELLLRPL